MAYSWEQQIYPAGSQNVTVSIAYLDKSFIFVYLDGELTSNYTWASDKVIRLDAPLDTNTEVLIVRRTEKEYLFIQFAAGAPFISENLDTQNTQLLHLAQEMAEGRSIEGFYGDISMNGYKITNLGRGTEPDDAVNFEQLYEVDERVQALEQSFVNTNTISYPYYLNAATDLSQLDFGFRFKAATCFLNGVCQTPGYSYEVTNPTADTTRITFADTVTQGTHIFVRIGEATDESTGYVTTTTFGSYVAANDVRVSALESGKLDAGATAVAATKLETSRNFQVNLNSTAVVGFDGTSNATLGITGTLPIAYGGTGAVDAANARANLSAAVSGINSDITALTNLTGGITGNVSGNAAAPGIVGQEISASSSASVPLTSGALASVVSISLPAGDWEIDSALRINNAGNVTILSFGVNTTSSALPTNWWDLYSITTTIASGTSTRQGMSKRLILGANTTLYLVAQATFTSTCNADGYIRARRVR